MSSHDDTAHPAGSPSSSQVGMIPTLERQKGRSRGRATEVDQLNSPPRLQELQRAGQMLAQISEIRETRIIALKRDVESGHYSVRAEQVAEMIMKDHLLDLCYSSPSY
jgi:anti-sigma28 factor (negative regulator of flagellin synthesis)